MIREKGYKWPLIDDRDKFFFTFFILIVIVKELATEIKTGTLPYLTIVGQTQQDPDPWFVLYKINQFLQWRETMSSTVLSESV